MSIIERNMHQYKKKWIKTWKTELGIGGTIGTLDWSVRWKNQKNGRASGAWRPWKNRPLATCVCGRIGRLLVGVGGLTSAEESDFYWSMSTTLRLRKNRKPSLDVGGFASAKESKAQSPRRQLCVCGRIEKVVVVGRRRKNQNGKTGRVGRRIEGVANGIEDEEKN
uniref:Uncharacterized protein n=1 Tax=Cucumis melo TaxID=3656 RepID=A0A9I9DXT5_CUCME